MDILHISAGVLRIMGLLSDGKPLSWAETKKHAELVRRVGVQQFLAIYHRLKDRKGDVLKWGDEVCLAIRIPSSLAS